ncbi:MAG: hypothetical protein WB493_14040 [Anaeromyxobacteraceae bacterium]
MGRRLEGLAQLVRTGLTPERIPPPPTGADPTQARKSLLALLFRPEPLPEAPPAAPRPGRSFLAAVLARETLPVDPPRPRANRRRWIHFLLAPERLDPPGGPGPEVH